MEEIEREWNEKILVNEKVSTKGNEVISYFLCFL
jgi:hypothetical protein